MGGIAHFGKGLFAPFAVRSIRRGIADGSRWTAGICLYLYSYLLIVLSIPALDAVGLFDSIEHHLQHCFIFLN